MCGIIGYKGSESPTPLVFNGLKNLEYRGYDSWGITFLQGKHLKTHKKVGKIANFSLKSLPGGSGAAIGHTRWATHGGVSARNAHPILSRNKEIAVAHNGIIENYVELGAGLKKKGFMFMTETDTEVIPMLIEEGMEKGLVFF